MAKLTVTVGIAGSSSSCFTLFPLKGPGGGDQLEGPGGDDQFEGPGESAVVVEAGMAGPATAGPATVGPVVSGLEAAGLATVGPAEVGSGAEGAAAGVVAAGMATWAAAVEKAGDIYCNKVEDPNDSIGKNLDSTISTVGGFGPFLKIFYLYINRVSIKTFLLSLQKLMFNAYVAVSCRRLN